MSDLSVIRQYYTLFVGYFLLIAGFLGNLLNIYLLSSIRLYRTKPSTFYFLVSSIFNQICLVVGLISRILEFGHDLHFTDSSLVWCKSREYFITTFSIIPIYCQCFATIDQYFSTSQTVRLRQRSSIKQAYWISFSLIVVSLLHGIPFLFYYEISPINNKCVSTSSILSSYFLVFVLFIILFLPTVITSLFGCLTYRNIRKSTGLLRQQADRQLTKMICMQIFLIVFTAIPYGLFQCYLLITGHMNKDQHHRLVDDFVLTVVSLNTYLHSSVRKRKLNFD